MEDMPMTPNQPAKQAKILAIADVQASADTRRIPINQVGIKEIRYPIRVRERSG
ncbi:MAG: GTP cyclohydrolase I FolE2, partial [Gammaproteobacteria bacterium]|nr:GTP cyclohydrolase I FolE2 [Gammaproteobacteria bacterium]